jgi:hypothetical protein
MTSDELPAWCITPCRALVRRRFNATSLKPARQAPLDGSIGQPVAGAGVVGAVHSAFAPAVAAAPSLQRSRRRMPVGVLAPPSMKTVNTPRVGSSTSSARNSGAVLSAEVTSTRAAVAVVTCV